MSESLVISYFAPSHHWKLKPSMIQVSHESGLFAILKDFFDWLPLEERGLGHNVMVAYLHKDRALDIEPIETLADRLAVSSPHLEYPAARTKISSLQLCDDDKKVQFFVRIHPDQPDFFLPGVERDHRALIQRISSENWSPSSLTSTSDEFLAYQRDHPIYIGHPARCAGPPITIYDEVFADIVHDLTHLPEVPEELEECILGSFGELAIKSLDVYDSEAGRMCDLHSLVETLLGVRMGARGYISTGAGENVVIEKDSAVYLHIGFKNELAMGSIRGFEGVFAYLKRIAVQPYYAAIRNNTCCPCIHVSVSGPYISFGGSILTDKFIFQPFTDYFCIGGNPLATSKVRETAKIFGVFRNAIGKLRSRYAEVYHSGLHAREPSRLLPKPTYEANSPQPEKPLVFGGHVTPGLERTPHRSLFHATYDGEAVLVNFSETYSEVAHRVLANVGLAPKLHFYSHLKGGVHMAIVEDISGSNALLEFVGEELPQLVVDRVKVALDTLHEMGFVHGDVRRTNILLKHSNAPRGSSQHRATTATTEDAIDQCYEVYLTGFDHVGRANVDRYSPFLNTVLLSQGMNRWWLMQKVHDDEMLKEITLRPGIVVPYTSDQL